MKYSIASMARIFVFLALAMFFVIPGSAADAPAPAAAPTPAAPEAALPHMQTKTTIQGTAEGGEKVPPEVPLNQPNIEPTALVPLMKVWVTESLNLQSDTYQDTLRAASRNFTKAGWATFTRSLQKAKVITTLLTDGMSLSIETGTPYIVREGEINGRYEWVLSVPLSINYYSAEATTDRRLVSVTVVRVPKKENVMGLNIDQWTMNE